MKKEILALSIIMLVNLPSAHAISAKYRETLERSGCTQVQEANGTCDVNKSKVNNARQKRIHLKKEKINR